MKKLAKLLALLMALLLVFGCFAGCNGNSTNTNNNNNQNQEDDDDDLDNNDSLIWDVNWAYDEMITITTARETSSTTAFYPGDSWESNHYYNAYRDYLNIDVKNEYEISGPTEYTSKVNLLISTGDIPDFLYVSPYQFQQMYEAGLLQSIQDVYDEYATDLLKAECEAVDSYLPSISKDGEIYAIPKTSILTIGMLWVREDWREKVGVSADSLKTLEGWETLAKKFIEEDPDGNGKANTIGFTGNLDSADENSLSWLFNAFGAYNGFWLEDDSGKMVYGSVQPEMRDALEYMARLYREGIIDKDFASSNGTTVYNKYMSHQLGIWNSKQWGATSCYGLINKVPEVSVKAYQYPSADGKGAKSAMDTKVGSMYVVSKDCAEPKAVISLANFFVEKTWNLKNQEECEYYTSGTYEGDGNYYHYRTAAAVYPGIPLEHYKTGKDCADFWDGKITLDEVNFYTVGCLNGGTLDWNWDAIFGPQGSITRLYVELYDQGAYVTDKYNGVPTDTMAQLWTALATKEAETLMQIVGGSKDITAFDDFVTAWYAEGGQTIVDEMNARK